MSIVLSYLLLWFGFVLEARTAPAAVVKGAALASSNVSKRDCEERRWFFPPRLLCSNLLALAPTEWRETAAIWLKFMAAVLSA